MSDLISRQAAIDALEKVAELYPWRVPGDRDSYSQYNEAWQDALNRADSEIEALSSAQQWILCSEQLPGADGTYLVYAPDYKGGSSSSKECHDGVMFSKFKNMKWSVEHGYYARPNCVMAWMPLPEPYKEDEQC